MSEGPWQSLEEFRDELGEVDPPVSPDMTAAVLEVLVWVVVVLELLYEVSVGLDEEVSVTATNPKERRFLAEICSKFLVEILVDR